MNLQKRKQIREMYRWWLPQIKKYYPRFDPYGGNWTSWIPHTRIEEDVWADIRYLHLPMVPEFPVLNYFIDFADPIKKIGIEVDSKKWHVDPQKDAIRQKEIEQEGWTIYRIQGWQTFKGHEDYSDVKQKNCECEYEQDENICKSCLNTDRDFFENCSEGILRRIRDENYSWLVNGGLLAFVV